MLPNNNNPQTLMHYEHLRPVKTWVDSRRDSPWGKGSQRGGGRAGKADASSVYGGNKGGRGRKRPYDGRDKLNHRTQAGEGDKQCVGYYRASFLEDPWLPLMREEVRRRDRGLPAQGLSEAFDPGDEHKRGESEQSVEAGSVKDEAEIELENL